LTNQFKGLLLILGLAVVFWIIIPIVLYVTLGLPAVVVFVIVNVIAMAAAVIFADRF
jgi:hypothetical protein